jgi:hypothetical protein
MEKIRLKGGSLSGTYLVKQEAGPPFVRKEVSVIENREYGFQRWYSQLKRMQRYSVLFPGLFPQLLTYGVTGDLAYFDMEYIPDAVTAHDFVVRCTTPAGVERLFPQLVEAMGRMHRTRIGSSANPLALYVREEVEQKLRDSLASERFRNFLKHEEIYFNGERVPSFIRQLERYKQVFSDAYQHCDETFTHGNITLENILYQPEHNRLIFIDPYDGYYELYNEQKPLVEGNRVTLELPRNVGLDRFDALLTEYISDRYSAKDMTAIRLLEVSQFIRMLPFKMVIDEDKMILFYALASKLFHNLRLSAA